MRKESYVVFGLGSFGYSVAETLGDSGYEVMVVDKGSDPIQSISSKITYAVKADVTDPGVLESLDISQFDVDMGVRVAHNLMARGMVDFLELSDEYRLTEIHVPPHWVGRSLNGLDVRGNYDLNVIAVKDGEEISMNIDPNQILREHQFLVVMGKDESLDRLLGGRAD